jgi:hypothetical protein
MLRTGAAIFTMHLLKTKKSAERKHIWAVIHFFTRHGQHIPEILRQNFIQNR